MFHIRRIRGSIKERFSWFIHTFRVSDISLHLPDQLKDDFSCVNFLLLMKLVQLQ